MLLASVLILFAAALVAPLAPKHLGRWSGLLIALAPAAAFAYFLSLIPSVYHTAEGLASITGAAHSANSHAGAPTHATEYPAFLASWVSQLDINLALRADGLALLFALLITGIGTLITVYAGDYLNGHPHHSRFFGYLLAFMASMLGLVLADDIISLFIFWELTSITSYLLIGFDHQKEDSRKAALQALLTTGLGGMALLAGLILTGIAAGTTRISEIVTNPEAIAASPLLPAIITLLLLGAFTKSAQFPFHSWLPGAMAAPTPVSAYLHSSTMVKAGVYLIARFNPAFAETAAWSITLIIVGGFTMVFAAYLSTRQTVFKRLLAFSTISSLATMVMLLGFGEKGALAAMAYLLAHAMFKGAMFLVAGNLDHGAHVKDAEATGGLATRMPLTAAAAILAAVSMAGVPPMFGFAGKELMLKASIGSWDGAWPLAILFGAAATLAGLATVFVALMVGFKPFFGDRPVDDAKREHLLHAHENLPMLWIGPMALAILGILAGIAPALFAEPLVASSTLSAAASLPEIHLDLAHLLKPSIAMALSIVAVTGGIALYAFRWWWVETTRFTDKLEPLSADRGFQRCLNGTLAAAKWQTSLLQNGNLRTYIKTLVLTLCALGFWAIFFRGALGTPILSLEIDILDIAIITSMALSTVLVCLANSRLAAVAMMGIVGFGVATTFVLYGAPDVAMTQFAIETLTVIIFVLVFYHLPRFASYSSKRARIADAAISLVFGALMTCFVLVATGNRIAEPISQHYAERSYLDAFGRNVVNVILVDYRGVDTMGEIFVLGLAAIAVFGLLKLRTGKAAIRQKQGIIQQADPEEQIEDTLGYGAPSRTPEDADNSAHARAAGQAGGHQ